MNGDTPKLLEVSRQESGTKVLSTYENFIDEIHSNTHWTREISRPNKALNVLQRTIKPLRMTSKKALDNGIWWYQPLVRIFEKGKTNQILSDIIVHGSHGDFSTTNFSDVEVTIVVHDSVFSNLRQKQTLSRLVANHLNKLIIRIDPTQHHGPFYLWSHLLNGYSNLILPVDAYRSCWSLTGNTIEFHVDSDPRTFAAESLKRLQRTLTKISRPHSEFFRFGYSEYSVKRYISNILLVPALYYQSKGSPLNKRDSIMRFQEERPCGFSNVIYLATEIRRTWPKPLKPLQVIRPHIVSTQIPRGILDRALLATLSRPSVKAKVSTTLLPLATSEAISLLEIIDENIQ